MSLTKKELQAELAQLIAVENQIDAELRSYFGSVAGSGGSGNGGSSGFDSADLTQNVKRIEAFAPCFEAMTQDSRKLATQIVDCRSLSDRLSIMVRRLDLMQIRAQQAFACTEDVINLKECKVKMIAAMEEGNLPLAVSFIRQVHDIDEQAAKASDDYAAIHQTEQEIRVLVQSEFNKAIDESNLNKVMSLCPLFQTLGLETEARDTFLVFVEKTVFLEVSADSSSVDDATDPATGYAQALSNVFNSSYIILQRYLPMVIQGMENSLGDVYFIRKLHSKCEREAGSVLKRYMKYRQIKATISTLKSANNNTPSTGAGANSIAASDIHVILDELALLIQYCCMYSKYLKQLTDGAEKRLRSEASVTSDSLTRQHSSSGGNSIGAGGSPRMSPGKTLPSSSGGVAHGGGGVGGNATAVVVFDGPTDFDKMVDELVNRYYMEGEHWLMKRGVKSALPKPGSIISNSNDEEGSGLDECFFVLQRCSQRALATNNIHAACAVLHLISDLLSSDLLQKCAELLSSAAIKATPIMQDHLSRFRGGASSSDSSSSGSISKGIKSAMSLASSIAGASSAATVSAGAGSASTSSAATDALGGDHKDKGMGMDADDREADDAYGLSAILDVFNTAEMCVRYTERLGRDVTKAGENVFGSAASSAAVTGDIKSSNSRAGSNTTGSPKVGQRKEGSSSSSSSSSLLSPEMEKLKLCKEDFEAATVAFQQTLKTGAEKVVAVAQSLMKDILTASLGRNGPLGGVKFDLDDDKFDAQPAVGLLPRILVTPFDMLLAMCTSGLSESNKDRMVGLMADACCERLEQYVTTSTFRFAGALKFEECVRAICATFTRFSTVPIRGKFSRLREVMLVLTSDVSSPGALLVDNFSHLTANEVLAFVALRMDKDNAQ